MTTDKAFEEMINKRGIYNKLGLTKGGVGRMRYDLRNNINNITLDLKINLLQKAGYKIVQDIVWKQP